jgi:hypothetical protein
MKVLLMHGLDTEMPGGGPTARCLRSRANADLELVLESMQLFELRNPLHPLAWRLRSGLGAVACLALGAMAISRRLLLRRQRRRAGIVAALGAVVCVRLFKAAKRWIVRGMMEHSLRIQQKALRRHKPDIVVASSWGGACCIELMRTKHWLGPTVLLAPAQFKIAAKAGLDRERDAKQWPRIPHDHPASVVIVHGDNDKVIPLADSEALIARLKLDAALSAPRDDGEDDGGDDGDGGGDARREHRPTFVRHLRVSPDDAFSTRAEMRVLMCEACGVPVDSAAHRFASDDAPLTSLRARELRVTKGETHKLRGVKEPSGVAMRGIIEYALIGARRVAVAV